MQISAPGLIRTSIILCSLGLASCVTAEYQSTRTQAPRPEIAPPRPETAQPEPAPPGPATAQRKPVVPPRAETTPPEPAPQAPRPETVKRKTLQAETPAPQETEKLAMQRHSTRPDELKKREIIQELILLDRFEYRVPRRADPKSYQTFKKQGGWSHVKAENITGSHAGYLYTVDRIPGYSGPFPGHKSASVLAIEARAGSMNTQTDFYLQYGDERAPANTVPANVWFQFWIYPNHYDDPQNREDQLSAFGHRFKFIYPCDGPYPCAMGNIHWLHTMGHITSEPYWLKAPNTELYMTTVDPFNSTVRYLDAPDWNQFKIGQTDLSEHIVPNRWTLVKLHYDTSTPSGSFEAWLRPLGGQWKKVAEWIDGQTRNFEWKIPRQKVGGHRVMRIPTTLDAFDSWIYIDDFAMATSEQALPRY